MILNLDCAQRINLIAVLDTVECQGRREGFAICKIQEQLDLNEEEKLAIGYKKERAPDGREYVMWNESGDGNLLEFKFNEDDSKRITNAIDNYKVILARDKSWWVPLVTQLPEGA